MPHENAATTSRMATRELPNGRERVASSEYTSGPSQEPYPPSRGRGHLADHHLDDLVMGPLVRCLEGGEAAAEPVASDDDQDEGQRQHEQVPPAGLGRHGETARDAAAWRSYRGCVHRAGHLLFDVWVRAGRLVVSAHSTINCSRRRLMPGQGSSTLPADGSCDVVVKQALSHLPCRSFPRVAEAVGPTCCPRQTSASRRIDIR